MLLKKWFLSANHREPYYLGRAADAMDDQLMKQHPPHEFSRPPRSIQKHMNHWKASELWSWLLYYSPPLLLNHLPPLYWHHYALLICAIYLRILSYQLKLMQQNKCCGTFMSFMVISAAQQMLIYSHTSRNVSVFGGHCGLTPASGTRTRMDISNISYIKSWSCYTPAIQP